MCGSNIRRKKNSRKKKWKTGVFENGVSLVGFQTIHRITVYYIRRYRWRVEIGWKASKRWIFRRDLIYGRKKESKKIDDEIGRIGRSRRVGTDAIIIMDIEKRWANWMAGWKGGKRISETNINENVKGSLIRTRSAFAVDLCNTYNESSSEFRIQYYYKHCQLVRNSSRQIGRWISQPSYTIQITSNECQMIQYAIDVTVAKQKGRNYCKYKRVD